MTDLVQDLLELVNDPEAVARAQHRDWRGALAEMQDGWRRADEMLDRFRRWSAKLKEGSST
jgi:hypothetical protein